MKRWILAALAACVLATASQPLTAQSVQASINGSVLDPSGAAVPGASVELLSVSTGVRRRVESDENGLYAFPNLNPGDYEIMVESTGFQRLDRSGISLRPNQKSRVDLELTVGDVTETVTVSAQVAPINFDNATQETGVGPDVINQLPLIVSGSVRDVSNFARLVPGVNVGGTGNNMVSARVNGGMAGGDEATVDGASMAGGGGNTGFINFSGTKMSPDMVGEFRMITSNYEPQYGATTSSQIVVTTKSGTNEYHGGAFWYHRNTVLNSRQFGTADRSKDIENDFGGFLGGKIPGLNFGNVKTFGYVMYEGFRVRGGVTRPVLTIPSLQQRQGDFSDWVDSRGNLIPVYDPATTRTDANGSTVRDQFACNGVPNLICPSRISGSLANEWLQHLPDPTSAGPLNNYVPPRATAFGQFDANSLMFKIDHHPADSDHISFMWLNTDQPADTTTYLPLPIANETFSDQYKDVFRANWDHTFSPSFLNTFNFGYTRSLFKDYGAADELAGQLPQIQGVPLHNKPPELTFSDGFMNFGTDSGLAGEIAGGGIYIFNDLATWVRGSHTFKFGGEYGVIRNGNPLTSGPTAGGFHFDRLATGLLGVNSGSPIASFLLEAVDTARAFDTAIPTIYPRRDQFNAHFGDTWRATQKLTLSMGLRWEMYRPAWEKGNNNSFFDPRRPNPGAGGRLGALAFAGDEWGEASFGSRAPEHLFNTAFAPRFGIAYAMNQKTVVRAGYGIFYSQAHYPGWSNGISTDGFSTNVSFSSTQGGLEPAMILSETFPQEYTRPPFIDPSFRNGQSIYYRDFNGNKLPYSQQWNLTIERQFDDSSVISVAYVANKGGRLYSAVAPINTLHPDLLSMGEKLYDQFAPGQQALHGVPQPYDGWAASLGCAPSLAQALLPFPQYCDQLLAANENAGASQYHSFQLKYEKQLSTGSYVLASYTRSKMLTNGGNIQSGQGGAFGSGMNGAFSPYERHREWSLANDDIPSNLTVAWVYDLPFGRGQRFGTSNRTLNKIVGGWQVSGIYRYSSGAPMFVRSGNCNVPSQFRARCVPALIDEDSLYLQSRGDYDPARGPLLNASAFESVSSFNTFGYYGAGPRILNTRYSYLQNWDVSVFKDTSIGEKVNLQLRFEFFNILNQHYFAADARFGGRAFNNNLSSPAFGTWNGNVSPPRNIQVGTRLTF